tara:strand:- start:13 stop:1158 length:1146 start_codon:yes stop_codon:yes gene_type:complete
MKRKIKLKINGESPRSIFLAFVLAKLKCDIYLYDFLINSNSNKDYQIFLFSNHSKNLLIKFDIWNQIKDISYSINSLSIRDNLISEQLLLQTENLSKNYFNNIGWTANYSDIKRLLINKLINFDNVHFVSRNQLIDDSLIFDYEFNFIDNYKLINKIKLPLSIFKRLEEQVLIFNVYLRGHVEKRLYEINTTKGLLVLTPLNKNLYQIIWNNPPFQIKETSLNSKSLFLDNLTTLLPYEFKIDQILGKVDSFYVRKNSSTYLIRDKLIYINENKFKSNTLYDFNFDTFIKNILKLNIFLDDNKTKNIKLLNRFSFNFLLRKYYHITSNISFSKSLLSLFILNNIYSLFIRKLLSILFRRVNLLKIFFTRNFMNSNINNLIE